MRVPTTLGPLCAALAALLPAVAGAQASVTIYGLIDVTARHSSNAGSGGANVLSDGAYTGSRIGFKGSEDLGGGMRAFFSLEQGIDPSTGTLQQSTATAGLGQSVATTGRAWGRESLVGLGSPYGAVTLGRQYTVAHQMSGRFQPQANPNEPALSVLSGHHVARQDNMIKYSHTLGPVGVILSVTGNEGNGKAYAVAGSYTAGALDVVAYKMAMKTNAAGTDTRNILGLGGSFEAFKGLRLFLGGMQRDHDVSLQKNKVLTGGLNYNLTDQLVLTASYTDDSQTGTGIGHRKVQFVGVNYFLSKRTDVYTEVDQNKITGAYPAQGFMATRGNQTGVAFGLRHRF